MDSLAKQEHEAKHIEKENSCTQTLLNGWRDTRQTVWSLKYIHIPNF